MSAYVVPKLCIDLLVSGMIDNKVWFPFSRKYAGEMDPTELGLMLWKENAASVMSRYPDDDYEDYAYVNTYKFKRYHDIKPALLAQTVGCYDYNACEHDEYETSEAKQAVDALVWSLMKRLPGYEAAPYGASDESEIEGLYLKGAVSLMDMIGGR